MDAEWNIKRLRRTTKPARAARWEMQGSTGAKRGAGARNRGGLCRRPDTCRPCGSTAARFAGLCAPRYLSLCREGRTDKLGPNLWGVYGRKMGQGSFNFSDVLRTSNLKLDDKPLDIKALDKWLDNPRALVPGNRMVFAGMSDAGQRKTIIDHLKTPRSAQKGTGAGANPA